MRIKGTGMKERQTLAMPVPGDMAARVKAAADADGRTVASLLRVLVAEGLDRRQAQRKG